LARNLIEAVLAELAELDVLKESQV
jgi:hypothetical protein